jgi:hypothetical protein
MASGENFSDKLRMEAKPISSLSPAAAAFQLNSSYGNSRESLSEIGMSKSFASSPAYEFEGGGSNPLPFSAPSKSDFELSSYKGLLYAVEFKAGRTEIFYILETDNPNTRLEVIVGELVIVEADRGEDLGKVTFELTVPKLKQLMNTTLGSSSSLSSLGKDDSVPVELLNALNHSKEIIPKRIHRLAQNADLKLLQAKAQEEAIAMVRCQSRIRQKKLPMEVVDAEYQWDRNKLTFYFCADRRIDFRELVRDLFRIYKTRIWMCAVDKNSPRMLLHSELACEFAPTTPSTNSLLSSSPSEELTLEPNVRGGMTNLS